MFCPTEIIFAATTACNLHCPHCFVNREPHQLKTEDALAFLKSAHESESSQIEKIGFSGGEPFLCVDFLCAVIKASVDYDFMFDRIMTNGDWWKSEQDLHATLQKIYDAGYDGKIGVSYDTFHAQSEERIATFIQTAWEIFGKQSVEIQSVKSLDCHTDSILLTQNQGNSKQKRNCVAIPNPCDTLLKSLAKKLNLAYEENLSKSGRGIATLTRDEIFLPAYIQTESYQANDSRAFKDKAWFKDDFCESMGQILFVHATGDIAPCCGFANENKALFIGKITDTFDTVLQKSRENNMVSLCFERGLSSEIKRLQKEGKLPAGKTSDICTFCDFVCSLKTER
ncbi:MAG: radical SAM protein [Treponema sp.]|nr:radical SAM protein [Treponema sp.]